MLYLEDFLELIENLPAELRDRFTEIRELDLQVQNGLDQSEARVRALFRAAPSIPPDERQSQFEKIKEEYRKILEDSDEKISLSTTVHDLLKRYLAKLDVEIAKFKMELEADKPGITEMLEQSLKGGQATANAGYGHKRERRRRRGGGVGRGDVAVNGNQGIWTNGPSGLAALPFSNGHGRDAAAIPAHHANVMGEFAAGIGRGGYANFRKSQSFPNRLMETRPPIGSMVHPSQMPQHQQQLLQQQQQQHSMSVQPPPPSYFQQQPPPPPPQQQQQMPHNPSMPSIRERTGTGSGSYGFLPSFTDQPESRHGRPRKLTSRVAEMLKEASHRHERLSSHDSGSASAGLQHQFSQGGSEDDEEADGSGAETADMSDQNDQQKWCICNQVSYGEMVACDNKGCPFEWFHYQCVGITAPPKGKWYCPHCTITMKRRNSKTQ